MLILFAGNALLHKLTTKCSLKLRVQVEAFDGVQAFADYATFVVGSPDTEYRLQSVGYSGTAGTLKINFYQI